MKRIIMFGTGGLSGLLSQGLRKENAEIIAYADSYMKTEENKCISGVPVINICDIDRFVWDYIVVAFNKVDRAIDVLKARGVSGEKIVAYTFIGGETYKDIPIWNACQKYIHDSLNDSIIREIFTYTQKPVYPCAMNTGEQLPNIIEGDFVREQTLTLLALEINRKEVVGNVAECGVFKGDFSKKINQLFPQKTLYLFDTFEGLPEKDIAGDKTLVNNEKIHAFDETDVESVLAKMPFRNKCVVKKGYFPDSWDLDAEKFSFVSLDVDLYDPIKNGLEIFYPRLSKGGYIMVHDYNNIVYKGTAKAVREYCDRNGLSYIPIPDISGSIVITK